MDAASVDVVLVRPARGRNVAAAARALKNMGLCSLVLVGTPPDDLATPDARALAYGAWDVLDGMRVAEGLPAAVAGCTLVAATSGRGSEEAWTPRRFAEEAGAAAGGGRVAVVFGPEASGLTLAELALCPLRVHIPASAAHPSLNLAQAVLVVAYEIRLACAQATPLPPEPSRATTGEMEEALVQLRDALLVIGYLRPDNPEAILAELRGLLARAQPRRREIALLRGLARQIAWAGGQIAPAQRGNDNRAASTAEDDT